MDQVPLWADRAAGWSRAFAYRTETVSGTRSTDRKENLLRGAARRTR